MYKFSFEFATTSANLTEVYLYDVTGSTETELYSSTTIEGAEGTVFNMVFDTNDDCPDPESNCGEERQISVGAPKTYEVRGTFTGTSTDSSVSTKMLGDASALDTDSSFDSATIMGSAGDVDASDEDDFIWSDSHLGSHGTTTADWTNGYLVDGLAATASPSVGIDR